MEPLCIISKMCFTDAYKTQVVLDLRSGAVSNRIHGEIPEIPHLPPKGEEEDVPLPGGYRGLRDPGMTAPIKRGDSGMTAPIKRGNPGMTAPIKRGDLGMTVPIKRGDPGMTAPIKKLADDDQGTGAGSTKKKDQKKEKNRPKKLPKGGMTAPIKQLDDGDS